MGEFLRINDQLQLLNNQLDKLQLVADKIGQLYTAQAANITRKPSDNVRFSDPAETSATMTSIGNAVLRRYKVVSKGVMRFKADMWAAAAYSTANVCMWVDGTLVYDAGGLTPQVNYNQRLMDINVKPDDIVEFGFRTTSTSSMSFKLKNFLVCYDDAPEYGYTY